MTAFASDAFTDSPSTTLGAHDANWTKITSYTTTAVTNGSAIYPQIFGNVGYYYNTTPPSADYSVSADLVYIDTNGPSIAGPCGRVSSSAATMYHAQYNVTAGEWRLWKQVSGTFTQLGSGVAQTLTGGNNYRLKLEMIGTAIKLYVDGVQKVSVTDSSISAAGFPGLRMVQSAGSNAGSSGVQLDNFSADPIASAGTLKTVNGLAIASVKTAQSLAKASMKTYNGLTP